METISTRHGEISVSGCLEWHPGGQLMSCAPAAEAVLHTSVGPLAPQHSTDDLRKRTVQAILFHPNGQLRSLPLERPTEVDTPAGRLTAELVTFHSDGSLSRVFPLNGKLSGYWTQEDEGGLAKPVALSTPLGNISARIIGVSFDPAGRLRSITLWPGETLAVPTPVGVLAAPVGVINAYDLDAVGISGDVNSLAFAADGSVERVATSLTTLRVAHPGGGQEVFSPASRESLCGDTDREPVPMLLTFGGGNVTIQRQPGTAPTVLPLLGRTFRTEPYLKLFAHPFGKMACAG